MSLWANQDRRTDRRPRDLQPGEALLCMDVAGPSDNEYIVWRRVDGAMLDTARECGYQGAVVSPILHGDTMNLPMPLGNDIGDLPPFHSADDPVLNATRSGVEWYDLGSI